MEKLMRAVKFVKFNAIGPISGKSNLIDQSLVMSAKKKMWQ